MGPVRHRQLIRLLSLIVAVDVTVALVAVYARGGEQTPSRDRDRVAAGTVQTPAGALQPGGILAGGNFTRRRTSPASPEPTTSTSAPIPAAVSPTTVATAPPVTPTTKRAVPATPPPGQRRSAERRSRPVADRVNDTFVAETDAPLSESRADIVRAAAAYTAGGITFVIHVQHPADPRADERWASRRTHALWAVDTNADTIADYEIQYYVLDEDNLGGSVSALGEDGPSLCDASSVTYSTDGYKVTVDPACLGNPRSFSYRASMYYDTDPADPDADVASDIAPDKGWSAAVRNTG